MNQVMITEKRDRVKRYTVMLLYPDTGNGAETYTTDMVARNPDEALEFARGECAEGFDGDPPHLECLLVCDYIPQDSLHYTVWDGK